MATTTIAHPAAMAADPAPAAMAADPAPAAGPTRRRSRILRRWPTMVAVGMAVTTAGGGDPAEIVAGYGEAMFLLPLLYLAVGKLERRNLSWPALGIGMMAMVLLRLFDVVAPSVVFVGAGLALLVWAFVDHVAGHRVREPRLLAAQAAGVVGFTALAVAGLAVDAEVGRWFVAAGWFLHGVWDLVHLRLDKVVSRSYAEWCGVIDILVAVQLAFLV